MDRTEEVLRKIERASRSLKNIGIFRHARTINSIPIIGRAKGRLLEDLVITHKPKRILEIGTLIGYSTILMARNMKNGNIISLEIDEKAAQDARKNVADAGLSDRVKIIVGDAKETIKELKGTFDFVFIDAEKNEYLTYLKLAERKMKRGAIVAADNAKIFAEHMKDYLDYVRLSGNYKSMLHDFGHDGVEVSVKL